MPQPIMKKYKQGEMRMEYGIPSKEKVFKPVDRVFGY